MASVGWFSFSFTLKPQNLDPFGWLEGFRWHFSEERWRYSASRVHNFPHSSPYLFFRRHLILSSWGSWWIDNFGIFGWADLTCCCKLFGDTAVNVASQWGQANFLFLTPSRHWMFLTRILFFLFLRFLTSLRSEISRFARISSRSRFFRDSSKEVAFLMKDRKLMFSASARFFKFSASPAPSANRLCNSWSSLDPA